MIRHSLVHFAQRHRRMVGRLVTHHPLIAQTSTGARFLRRPVGQPRPAQPLRMVLWRPDTAQTERTIPNTTEVAAGYLPDPPGESADAPENAPVSTPPAAAPPAQESTAPQPRPAQPARVAAPARPDAAGRAQQQSAAPPPHRPRAQRIEELPFQPNREHSFHPDIPDDIPDSADELFQPTDEEDRSPQQWMERLFRPADRADTPGPTRRPALPPAAGTPSVRVVPPMEERPAAGQSSAIEPDPVAPEEQPGLPAAALPPGSVAPEQPTDLPGAAAAPPPATEERRTAEESPPADEPDVSLRTAPVVTAADAAPESPAEPADPAHPGASDSDEPEHVDDTAAAPLLPVDDLDRVIGETNADAEMTQAPGMHTTIVETTSPEMVETTSPDLDGDTLPTDEPAPAQPAVAQHTTSSEKPVPDSAEELFRPLESPRSSQEWATLLVQATARPKDTQPGQPGQPQRPGDIARRAADIQAQAANLAAPTLPETTRRFLRPLTGVDPADVRFHHGALADQITSDQQADAVTLGNDVFLAAGHADESPETMGLLAHELTHVARQREQRFVPPLDDAAVSGEERRARRVEATVRRTAQHRRQPEAGRAAGEVVHPATPPLPPAAELLPDRPAAPVDSNPDQLAAHDPAIWGLLPAPWESLPAWLETPASEPGAAPASEPGAVALSETAPAPQTAEAAQSATPAVAHVWRAETDRSLELETPAAAANGASAPDGTPAELEQASEPDLDLLARQVYALLKQRLALERRRAES